MQTLKIGKLEPDPCSTNKKSEYISLDKPIRIGVLATYSNKPKPITELLKKPVKQILHQRIQKKKE